MADAPAPEARSRFLQALDKLHERFLVGDAEATEVWLVRHGDAYAELVSLDDSNIDPPLSGKGREEAEKLGVRLRDSSVSAVWASPIRRAQETAAIAGRPAGLTLRTDARLREVKTHWEDGATPPEPSDTGYIPFVEPLDEVIARMDGAVRDIVAAAGPGARVAAVTHAGAISMYLLHVLKLDSGPLRVLPLFTSVSVLLVKGDRMVVQSIGDVSHLLRDVPAAERPGG